MWRCYSLISSDYQGPLISINPLEGILRGAPSPPSILISMIFLSPDRVAKEMETWQTLTQRRQSPVTDSAPYWVHSDSNQSLPPPQPPISSWPSYVKLVHRNWQENPTLHPIALKETSPTDIQSFSSPKKLKKNGHPSPTIHQPFTNRRHSSPAWRLHGVQVLQQQQGLHRLRTHLAGRQGLGSCRAVPWEPAKNHREFIGIHRDLKSS